MMIICDLYWLYDCDCGVVDGLLTRPGRMQFYAFDLLFNFIYFSSYIVYLICF